MDVHTLANGDKIQLGKLTLRFEDLAAKAPARPEEKAKEKKAISGRYLIAAAAVLCLAIIGGWMLRNSARANKIQTWLQSANLAMTAGNFEQAANDFRSVLQMDPANVPARQGIAISENRAESKRLIEGAKTELANKNNQYALELVNRALQLDAENASARELRVQLAKTDELLADARAFYLRGDHEIASRSYFDILRKEPNNKEAADALLRIAQEYNGKSKYAESIAVCDQLLQYRPDFYPAMSIRNEAKQNRQQWTEAREQSLKAAAAAESATATTPAGEASSASPLVDGYISQMQDAFNFAEYDRSAALAQQILQMDSMNERARGYLSKVVDIYKKSMKENYASGNLETADLYMRKIQDIRADDEAAQYRFLINSEVAAAELYKGGLEAKQKDDKQIATVRFLTSKVKWQNVLAQSEDNQRAVQGIKDCETALAELGSVAAGAVAKVEASAGKVAGAENVTIQQQPPATAPVVTEAMVAEANRLLLQAEESENAYKDYGRSLTPALENWEAVVKLLPATHELAVKAQEKLREYKY